jgi:hypothetical protein
MLLLDDDLVERARKLTGIDDLTTLVHVGLQALIASDAAKRLAALGGSQPNLSGIRRRRPLN